MKQKKHNSTVEFRYVPCDVKQKHNNVRMEWAKAQSEAEAEVVANADTTI